MSPARRYAPYDIGGMLVLPGDILPNPWVDVAPLCPEGHEPADVYLWHPKPEDGLGRWFCSPCGKRFTPQRPPHRIPTGGP